MIQRRTKWREKTCVTRGQLRRLGKIFCCKYWDQLLLRSSHLCIMKQLLFLIFVIKAEYLPRFQRIIVSNQLIFFSYLFWFDATFPIIYSSTFVELFDGAIDIDYFRFV